MSNNNLPHFPVLLNEVMEYISPANDKIYVDATFGAGGYSKRLLEIAPKAKIVAIDRDENVKMHYQNLLKQFNIDENSGQVIFVNDLFSNIEAILKNLNIEKVDGVMMDFGVSSMQLDQAERGFSFSQEAPLSMQMGKCHISAYEVVNSMKEEDLANIIYNLGGERMSRRIAKAICKSRAISKIETTTELASIVTKSVGFYNDKIHPATRTFQAIRIYVNQELEEIEKSVQSSINILNEEGRIACVSFHSLEDRIVKDIFRKYSGYKAASDDEGDEILNWLGALKDEAPKSEDQAPSTLKILTKKPVTPSKEEASLNPRSRSAKLRVAERI